MSCPEHDPALIEAARRRVASYFNVNPYERILGELSAENLELRAITQHPENVLARLAFEQYQRAEKFRAILSKILIDKVDVLELCDDFIEEL